MANVSPGVFVKVIDLSTYVQEVLASVGLICCLTKKGEDNKLKFIGSRSELISEFGEPNINDYGQAYSQGPYFAYNFLGESGGLYFMRCLPDDAQYANLGIQIAYDTTGASPTLSLVSTDSLNTYQEMDTALAADDTPYMLGMFYPIGRGQEYNKISVDIKSHTNPMYNGVYVLDIYEKQSDGDDVIIESFEISLDKDAMDSSGESMFITHVLEQYSSVLRFKMSDSGYDVGARVFDHEIGTVTVVDTTGSAKITDTKQDFRPWIASGNYAQYVVIAKDIRGTVRWGWLGTAGVTNTDITVFNARNTGTAQQNWIVPTGTESITFDTTNPITYRVMKVNVDYSTLFTTHKPLKYGSDGGLLDSKGDLVTATATNVLSQGYLGQLLDPTAADPTTQYADDITDTESIEFNLAFDGGYPTAVKTSIVTMVETRKDCVAILDNGSDNNTVSAAISSRRTDHTYNNFLVALYEGYSKVYDSFTGKYIWFSPLFHMSYLLPRNDRVGEIWYAAAGLNRGIIDNINELKFNPKLAERDQLYLSQLNPIVKFTGIGYTVWGQLTSQTKPSAMQDLNIVRLYLYCAKALSNFCKYFIFEQNDQLTYNLIKNQIVEFLESVKQRRGLYDYSVEVGATDYERKQKKMHVNVTLNPTRVVEKVELNFFIV